MNFTAAFHSKNRGSQSRISRLRFQLGIKSKTNEEELLGLEGEGYVQGHWIGVLFWIREGVLRGVKGY
jgi:hypothetical protein